MNRLLMSESPVFTKVKNNRSRRALQVLQVSATDKDLLASPNLMNENGKKPTKAQKKIQAFQDELLSKENTPDVPIVRRSKRKNVATQEVKKVSSEEVEAEKAASTKVSKVAKSKKTSTRKTKMENSANLKQSKMDSFIASSSTSNTIFESNLENDGCSVDNATLLKQTENSVEAAISSNNVLPSDTSPLESDKPVEVTLNMLTSDNPPQTYWKMLAEERRIALEKALRENEQLHDQLQVLETENSQLKSCLKDAEKLAEALRQALE